MQNTFRLHLIATAVAILFSPVAFGAENAEVPLSFRESLAVASPILERAIQDLENERGRPLSPVEIKEAFAAGTLRQAYQRRLDDFCEKAENKSVVACLRNGERQ